MQTVTDKRREESWIESTVARRLRLRREEMRLTEEQLADLLSVTPAQYRRYESGQSRIPLGRLCRASRSLHVRLDWFFEGVW